MPSEARDSSRSTDMFAVGALEAVPDSLESDSEDSEESELEFPLPLAVSSQFDLVHRFQVNYSSFFNTFEKTCSNQSLHLHLRCWESEWDSYRGGSASLSQSLSSQRPRIGIPAL